MVKYLTVDEVAEATGRHPETVRLALRAGELRGFQRMKRGTWQVSEADIEPWVTGIAVAA